jgi:hypothetical protein
MDAKGRALYRGFLRQQTKPERMYGIVAGETWGESGFVYGASPESKPGAVGSSDTAAIG